MTQATVACRTAACFALAARVLQCFLKFSLRSNQMPSQRVALPAGGGVTVCEPWGVCIEHVGLEWLVPRVKCCSSVLLKSKFSSKEGEATSWHISSAYPKRPRRVRTEPCLKMGSMNNMKRIGEIGEPCGRPAGTWNVWLVWFPR